MDKLIKKHDQLAKSFLSDISIAKEFLNLYVPNEVLSKCNLDSLQIESGSYIDEDLAETCCDIVYKLDLKNRKGTAYIYSLVEHQSRAEKLMPLRILKYQIGIIENHLKNNNKVKKLPIVVALVFYNGKQSPYPYHLDIEDLFENKQLYRQAPLGKFALVDLTVKDDEEILQHKKLAVLEILLKHIRLRDIRELCKPLFKVYYELSEVEDKHLIYALLSYIVNAREAKDVKQLIEIAKEQGVEFNEEIIMTYAEELTREGIKKGIQLGKQEGIQLGKQEGIQEGIQEGEHIAQLKIAAQLLKAGIDTSIIMSSTNLTLFQIEELKNNIN